MLNSTKSNLIDNLRKFRFQKKVGESEDSSQDNEMNSRPNSAVDVDTDSSHGSESQLCNGSRNEASNQHSMSDSGEDSNSRSNAVSSHAISDSDEKSDDSVRETKMASNNTGRIKKRPIASSSDSDDKNSKAEEPQKVYSRIKTLNSFKFKKKAKLNNSSSESESETYNEDIAKQKHEIKKYEDRKYESQRQEVRKQDASQSQRQEFRKQDTSHFQRQEARKQDESRSQRLEARKQDASQSLRQEARKQDAPRKNKRKKRRKTSSETEEENDFKEEFVYDSEEEDSDYEVSDEMNSAQKKVFDFLNSASSVELLQIQSCTQNRVNALMECRPFLGWKDLVTKLKTGKNMGTQLLNFTLNSLKTRDTISTLMKKCLNIAIKTEKCIEEGAAGIKEQPSILCPELRLKGYQMVGLNWLVVMHNQNLSGILADEMGLGKTIQVIAFLAYLKETGLTHAPHLVVAPSTTLENWAMEFTKWCPDIRLGMYRGSQEERRALRVQWFKQKFKEIDVIITSYSMVSGSFEEKKMFRIMPMQYAIFDEAHMLKNMNTQRYFSLSNVSAEHRILLTGTPLQNNLLELVSLLNFVTPNMFVEKISYVKAFFSKNGKVPVENLPEFEQEQIELAKRIMKPFVLRRLKEDVLKDLPEKTSSLVICDLIPDQKEKYDNLVKELKELAAQCSDETNYMSSFMNLRRLANHPLATRYIYNNEKLLEMSKRLAGDYLYKESNENYVFEDLSFMSDYEIHRLTTNYKCISKFHLQDSDFVQSGKFKKLDEILPKLKEEGHRVIMFSQFVFMLDLLEEYLRIRNHTSLRLDGSIKSLERQDLINNYNEDSSIFVFLLTTRTGGVGINLTTADTVIIHDIDFNPYNDKQAEDRCHRLGQSKPVRIMRLISKGTVEEEIYSKAQSKLNLEQELTGTNDDVEEAEENKNVEVLLKELLGLKK